MSISYDGMSFYVTCCHFMSHPNPPEISIFKIIGYPVLLAGQEIPPSGRSPVSPICSIQPARRLKRHKWGLEKILKCESLLIVR